VTSIPVAVFLSEASLVSSFDLFCSECLKKNHTANPVFYAEKYCIFGIAFHKGFPVPFSVFSQSAKFGVKFFFFSAHFPDGVQITRHYIQRRK
jgi:hypothetical protein